MVDERGSNLKNSSCNSTWLGRYSFNRSVYHQIDSRRIPHVCFAREREALLPKSTAAGGCGGGDGIDGSSFRSSSSSFRSSSSSSLGSSNGISSLSCCPANPLGNSLPAKSPAQNKPNSHKIFESSPSSSTASGSGASSPLMFIDQQQQAQQQAQQQTQTQAQQQDHPPMTKRIESWSQYLEGEAGEVHAVEKAEAWFVDMSQLFLGHKFASGAHSRLYHGIYKGKAVAVKVMRRPDEDEAIARMVERQFTHEVSLLSSLHHRNIVQFVAACKKTPVYCVITEYMPGGSLRSFLHKNEPSSLPLKMLLGMAIDIARGMDYIHSQGVIHGDLKSENLVLDQDMCVKITDFGVARRCEEVAACAAGGGGGKCGGATTTATADSDAGPDLGTYRWMAPEMISYKRCSCKVDVYSFGIVLWELLTGMVPFEDMNAVQAAFAVVHKNARPDIPATCPSVLARLMQRCWSCNPDKRPDFSDVVKTLEQFEESSSKTPAYNTWHCPSDRTKYFLGCFTRCKKCTSKCNCT